LAALAAEKAKSEGNALFQAKDYLGAIRRFSEAIELQPESWVLYSNRSAAYLASGDAKSKAFKDAEKCVALAPTWAKGHARLGAAQHALGRFAAAQASYLTASSLDGEGKARYEAGLEAAKEGERRATAQRIAEERAKEKLEEDMARKRAALEAARREEARLDEFFGALGDDEKAREKAKKALTNPVTEKYRTQALGTAKENVQRLAAKHYDFRNLNPYLVLKLDVDATIDDVKIRYRKLSALCHPDKNLDDPENARIAFEAVKAAHQTLTEPKLRDRSILVIQGARDRAKAAYHQQQPHPGQQLVTLEEFCDKEILKTFAQNEMKRRDVEEHKRVNAARDMAQQAEEKKKQHDERVFEEAWNDDERRNARIDFWQQFQDDSSRAGAQKRIRTAKNFKQQEKLEKKPKYGNVHLETWRKEWK